MTACQPIGAEDREVAEIDTLQRALRGLRHWAATAQARRHLAGEQGRRLHATALRLHDEAWSDCLAAAYGLFEIDAIHQAWVEAGGGRE
ncbi:hypothetical protein [Rhizorhabdus dicambivorans]|uniref:Uncharacterized protein n=1 Tax=Rhizorhabdus dicambivorans TaxID=1850238 RepID=A0A2A4FZ80_9SPHN|nr:hypothetical protein [Rhizorhabdus dicambivorans]ATE65916.1 hypothetical protein CMV14_17155 [Rhizorhabdus dicambivorans]PCE43032.1 hypothetical protein COO09_06940 [Rhizorhabdus dicambivorans]